MTPAVVGLPVIRRSLRTEISAAVALFVLTVRQHTHGRRLLVLGLLYAVPCGLAILLRSLARPAPSDELEFYLVLSLLPHGLAPLTALLFASGIIRDEIEEQTLTYLLLRAVPRWAVYAVRWLATLCVTIGIVTVATTGLYLAIYWGTPECWGEIFPSRVLWTAAAMAVGQVGYCALFGVMGLVFRRSLVAGVAYIATVEGVLANLDFVGRKLTVVYYVRALFLRWLEPNGEWLRRWKEAWGMDLGTIPSAERCVLTVGLFGLVVTLLTAWWFAGREFHVKTPGGG
jgi:ABC-2 type transport system permease protein